MKHQFKVGDKVLLNKRGRLRWEAALSPHITHGIIITTPGDDYFYIDWYVGDLISRKGFVVLEHEIKPFDPSPPPTTFLVASASAIPIDDAILLAEQLSKLTGQPFKCLPTHRVREFG